MTRALGRYELLRPIARGGMAEVFLARRRGAAGVEKRLVIKRIRPERSASPRLLELFVREARLSMALAHQNIVPVFDFGRAGDELFLAMEHVDGHDLGDALGRAAKRGQPIDPVLAAFVAAECCQALDYAHTRTDDSGRLLGVVHRDVTPRNVLLSMAGEVKLVDFGVASLSGEAGGRLRGTPAYMAPEQARGEPVDGRADLYALGIILWEALTGLRARSGDQSAIVQQAQQGQLPPLPDDVPAPLAQVIRRATAVAPADRFADARAMAEALDAYIVSARAARPELPSPARRLSAWLRELWPEGEEVLTSGTFELDAQLPSGPAATFVDDGEAAVLGRETQRSIAATIGEDDEAAPPPAPAPTQTSEPAPTPRRRSRWVALTLLGAGGAAAIGIAAAQRPARAPVALPIVVSDAAPAPAAPPADAALLADATPPAAPDAAPVPPPHKPPVPPRPRPVPTPVVPKTSRKVTLGARPWARFTIDADATPHETPETVELTPGRHVIHFENPEMAVRRDVILVVPADHDIAHVENLVER
jgi:serine/threonine protein kinase